LKKGDKRGILNWRINAFVIQSVAKYLGVRNVHLLPLKKGDRRGI
jgi:hypothetical protein